MITTGEMHMITEDYATALKNLISLTQTKNIILANITGYDISYISKWANNTSQPTKKHIERINDTLSSIFAEEIIHKDYAYLFLKEFNIAFIVLCF